MPEDYPALPLRASSPSPDAVKHRQAVAGYWNHARADAEALGVDDPVIFAALLVCYAISDLAAETAYAGQD